MSDRFEKHAWTVSLLTFVSRITGLARDAVLSRIFGAGAVTDAFFFAFLIPNLFRRLFGEGALAAAFLPVYSQLDRNDPHTARQLATFTIASLCVLLGSIVLLAEIALLVVDRQTASLPLTLTMIMLPYTPLVCVVAILGAMLQVHGRFGPTAAAPVVLNLFIIGAAVGGWFAFGPDRQEAQHITIVAIAVIGAGAVQVAWSLFALRKQRWWVRDFRAAREPMRRVVRQALPMILGLGVLQLNTLFDGIIASYPTAIGPTIFGHDYPLSEGAMASVSFAQRLYQFPLGVFGIAVATAIFPALARSAHDHASFIDIVRRGLRLVVFIGLPASAGLMLVREPLTAAVLQGGDFNSDDTRRVGFVLLGYAPAIWAYSMTHVLTRAFYARSDSMTPVKIALAVVALNLALNVTLIWTPLREAGLAWSTALCAIVQVTLLAHALSRRTAFLLDREVARSWMKTIAATAGMSISVGAVMMVLPIDAESWAAAIVTLFVLVVVGMLVFVALAVGLRMPELRWALGRGEKR